MVDSPSGRVPEKASRWDVAITEACGGGKSILGGSLLVTRFYRIYRVLIRSNEGMWGPQGTWARLPPGHTHVACGPLVPPFDLIPTL